MREIAPVLNFQDTASSLLPHLRPVEVDRSESPIVVLDDDPTGTQTVHGVSVITSWSVQLLTEVLSERPRVLFVLTNSRAVPESEAVAMNREIARSLCTAAQAVGTRFEIVSRSDSTLRGHYPAEIKALKSSLEEGIGAEFAGELIIPSFFEGGRYTIDDVHYVRDGERLIPAAETEYAQDRSFGYASSNLKDWIAEKTGGLVPASEVLSIGLTTIRTKGVDGVLELLRGLERYRPIVVNAFDYGDLEVVSQALRMAEREGRQFLYRTAASFVRAFAAISERSLLTAADVAARSTHPTEAYPGGLVVVGSHIRKSSEQLAELLARVEGVELSVGQVTGGHGERVSEIDRVTAELESRLEGGGSVVLYTSRKLKEAGSREANLTVGKTVSDALVSVVARLGRRPAFVIAKGGITSSDVATRALGIDRAEVIGQIHPGVPVWVAGKGSRFPGLPYVVFPGNVGDSEALSLVYQHLTELDP